MCRQFKTLLRSRVLLFYLGALFVVVQCFVLIFVDRDVNYGHFYDELQILNALSSSLGIVMFIFDPELLKTINAHSLNLDERLSALSPQIVTLAVDSSFLENSSSSADQILTALSVNTFQVETFIDHSENSPYPKRPVGFLVRRTSSIFNIRVLHEREDSSWWMAGLSSDSNYKLKLSRFGIEPSDPVTAARSLKKFALDATSFNRAKSSFWIPKYASDFIEDFSNSEFVECNYTRAKQLGHLLKRSADGIRFAHKVRKVLALVSTTFDSLKIPFWISSGTCLGYLRHCAVIPHSKDVDIGMFATDFSSSIVDELDKRNVKLHLRFGELNDSFELSFLHVSKIKLDLFFFYKGKDVFWNGGTQARTGKKFKYTFPKFELCWTLFLGLRVRVPCDTESYIKANYGPRWYIPALDWDWKTSPHNVRENGFWSVNRRSSVIEVFNPSLDHR